MSKRVHTTLGTQMCIGTGLEIVFLVMRWGLVIEVITRHPFRGWVARASLGAVTTWALSARCAVMRWSCAMRGLSWVGATRRALSTLALTLTLSLSLSSTFATASTACWFFLADAFHHFLSSSSGGGSHHVAAGRFA